MLIRLQTQATDIHIMEPSFWMVSCYCMNHTVAMTKLKKFSIQFIPFVLNSVMSCFWSTPLEILWNRILEILFRSESFLNIINIE